MPFDGSGTFTRVTNWVADATAGIKIRADKHDLQDDDIINGLSLTITRDGQTQPTAHIPLNNHRLINVAEPINDNDVVTKGWLQRTTFTLTGSDVLGRIRFLGTEADAPAGKPLGIEWAQSDMFFGVRKKPASQPALPAPPIEARWVFNDKADASGTDWVTIEKTGLMVVAKLGVTGTLEWPQVTRESYNAYLTPDGSAWRYRTAGHAMVWTSNMPSGDGGALILHGDGGLGSPAKDATVAFEQRFIFYRRGGMVITPSEYTHGLLIQRPEVTGQGYYAFYCTQPVAASAAIFYEAGSTYYTILELYQAGVNYWGVYNNHANYSSGGWVTSDARVKDKQRIEDCDHACSIVKKVPVVSYEKRSERIANQHTHFNTPVRRTKGFRAQDVQQILPEAVMEHPIPEEDMLHRASMKGLARIPQKGTSEWTALKKEKLTMLAMDDRVMLSTLWAATQKLLERVEKLEAA